ncbi:MAG: molybdate transport system ATP-binding protein [Bermanella sp.]|jgi:molybdate transport system ATP-binding protein
MINFNNFTSELYPHRHLTVSNLDINKGESWAFIGSNGSGKSAFCSLFTNTLPSYHGELIRQNDLSVGIVSFDEQQRLINRENARDDSDITNKVFEGTPVNELLLEINSEQSVIDLWVSVFNIQHILTKGFRKLSTGESRKVILIRALLQPHDLLVLDEPFDGLDANSQQALQQTLETLNQQGQTLVLILNRLDEVPDWIGHLGFLQNCHLLAQGTKQRMLDNEIVKAYLTFDGASLTLPSKDPSTAKLTLEPEQPLVALDNGRVAYSDRLIFENLNWTIKQGEHWAVLGPNGCGKSTLLNLISGDHPQCYSNDLIVFGIKRGSGESIWDIKKHIGIISSALQWQYKATTNVISTVLSGLFDSIGLYNKVDDDQKKIAMEWLKQVGLDHHSNSSLHQLSYGEQRLVLLCRAMIKQPALLILDEPCQGLDEPNRQLVLGFINLLAQQKATTLLYVTHHQTDSLSCFDKSFKCTASDDETGSHWEILSH